MYIKFTKKTPKIVIFSGNSLSLDLVPPTLLPDGPHHPPLLPADQPAGGVGQRSGHISLAEVSQSDIRVVHSRGSRFR